MRGIRGYIRNLADGAGPPTGTVDVSAIPKAKPPDTEVGEIGETKHRLGKLLVLHQPGSASATKADQDGRFGWEMELSPGPIDIRVTPHDPQTEYRRRFPDESAQIGKAFLTDIERLGWAGGKDGLIWDGVYGGHQPTAAQWTSDPGLSTYYGNWSIGPEPAPGRVTIRKGIAMLGGVVFSVEMGDLAVPVAGEPPMPPNATAQDRWDLLCLRIDWNPLSPEYGQQSFEFIKGGTTIPPLPANSGNFRRLPLHALRMAANTSSYAGSYDLRSWANPPAGVLPPAIIASHAVTFPDQTAVGAAQHSSLLNNMLSQNEIVLPTGCAWDGYAVIHGFAIWSAAIPNLDFRVTLRTEGRIDPGGAVQPNSLYITPSQWPVIAKPTGGAGSPLVGSAPFSFTFPLHRIPAFNPGDGGRSWSRLKFVLNYGLNGGSLTLREEHAEIHLWPVT